MVKLSIVDLDLNLPWIAGADARQLNDSLNCLRNAWDFDLSMRSLTNAIILTDRQRDKCKLASSVKAVTNDGSCFGAAVRKRQTKIDSKSPKCFDFDSYSLSVDSVFLSQMQIVHS